MVWGVHGLEVEGEGMEGEWGEGGSEKQRKRSRGKRRFCKESVANGSIFIRSLMLGSEGKVGRVRARS